MSELSGLRQRLDAYSKYVTSIETISKDRKTQLQTAVTFEVALQQQYNEMDSVHLLLEKCNITAREMIKEEIDALTTNALRTVFEDPTVSFETTFLSKRNQIEAEFSLTFANKKKKITGDILDSFGGGVVDVITIALRLILLELLKIPGPIVLDEPGRMIAAQYIENFGNFLHSIGKQFERQIILITHNDKLADYADNRIEVAIQNGVSRIV